MISLISENNNTTAAASGFHSRLTLFQANNLVLHTAIEHFRRNCRAAEQDDGRQNGSNGLPHIITSNVEHDSVKLAAEHLQRDGKAGRRMSWLALFRLIALNELYLYLITTNRNSFLTFSLFPDLIVISMTDYVFVTDVTYVPVSKVTARVEVEDIIAAVRPNTCLISIMLANNETGVIMVRN